VLSSAWLAKSWEVAARAGRAPRLVLPMLPLVSVSGRASASGRPVTGIAAVLE